ncbi:MAG: helix-turn-helix domain-containing protein [Oscillospiraceae bacterium]|nr:helix-turn-helix domain-containing protein [Oscillospiraceae bacterium]
MIKIRQDISIGSNLRALRKKSGLTQKLVATKMQLLGCDINRSVYSRYEIGGLNIRVSDLIALRKIFDCRYDDFFDGLN